MVNEFNGEHGIGQTHYFHDRYFSDFAQVTLWMMNFQGSIFKLFFIMENFCLNLANPVMQCFPFFRVIQWKYVSKGWSLFFGRLLLPIIDITIFLKLEKSFLWIEFEFPHLYLLFPMILHSFFFSVIISMFALIGGSCS